MVEKIQLTQAPVAKAEMLIRKPVEEVFEAFINPEVTSNFWFTKGSGMLEAGKQVTWEWEMYSVSAEVKVLAVEENRRIVIEWQGYGGPTKVEWVFTPYGEGATFVSVAESGFGGDGDAVVSSALGSTGGFTWVLAGLKAWLEHGVRLNLVADRYPKGLSEH
ncbi:polyketide cyclase [Candidatus Bathyarchaeota archaeon RBG_16_57_9]|nr:MAG: polyketide cyclase [Candidatus Bathyarchaeota archaeon RBG_16_57_9]